MLPPEIDDVRHAAVRSCPRLPASPCHRAVAAAGRARPGHRRPGGVAAQSRGLGLLRHRRGRPAGQRHPVVRQPPQRGAAVRTGVHWYAAVDLVGVRQRLLALGAAAGPGDRARHRAGAARADPSRTGFKAPVAQRGVRADAGVRGGLRSGFRPAWRSGWALAIPGRRSQCRTGTYARYHWPAAG